MFVEIDSFIQGFLTLEELGFIWFLLVLSKKKKLVILFIKQNLNLISCVSIEIISNVIF